MTPDRHRDEPLSPHVPFPNLAILLLYVIISILLLTVPLGTEFARSYV